MSEWARNKLDQFHMPKNIGSLEADETRIKQICQCHATLLAIHPRVALSGKRSKMGAADGHRHRWISQEDQKRIFEPFERSGRIKMLKTRRGLGHL